MSFTQRQEDDNPESEDAHLTSSGIRANIPGLVAGVPIQPVLWFKSSLGDVRTYVEINTTCQIRAHTSTSGQGDASTNILLIFLF